MISHPDTSNDHILSSDNIHYLHHSFFEPSNQDMAIKATLLIVHGMAEHKGLKQPRILPGRIELC